MSFQFQLLGLLFIMFIVIRYYSKYDILKKETVIFRGILLGTYLSQLLYMASYIAISNHWQDSLYVKGYFVVLMLIFSLFTLYLVRNVLRDTYQNKIGEFDKIISWVYRVFWFLNGISFLGILFSNLRVEGDRIYYCNGRVVEFFILFYLVVQFLFLLISKHKKNSKCYFLLVWLFLIEVIAVVFQSYFVTIDILNSGIVFLVIYLYLLFENPIVQEVRVLRLERDYHARQNIDKVAFLKNISHEIRTPINTIDGFSQIILDSNDIDEIKGDVKDIRVASRELMDVINGMIDLSIIESGNLEIMNENYNVYDMFDGVIEIVQSKLRDKDVSLEVNIDKSIPEVLWGDSERFSQVLLNIFKNSIKYTDKGNISLVVETVKSKAMCRFMIIIQDTGRGMKEEEIQKLFMDSNEEKRNGIGLLVSKHLVDLMDGSLEVKSTYGEGTEVTITLDQKIISEKQVEKSSSRKGLKPFKANDKRVLIVDDNKLNLKVASRLLEPYGVEVVEANSGKECLDLLEKDICFDLILMDDLMPEMSGSETMNILKKIQRVDGYYIPVVVVTANAISGQREKYLEMGFEDYLSKPIERYELDRVLRKYLKGKK